MIAYQLVKDLHASIAVIRAGEVTAAPRIRLTLLQPERREGYAQCVGCGKCCKNAPGKFVPADFGKDVKRMEKAIRDGIAQIDYWEPDRQSGMKKVYYIRASAEETRGLEVVDALWGGPCAHHSDTNGCALSYDDRPKNCRDVVPNWDGSECMSLSEDRSKELMAWDYVKEWRLWQRQIVGIIDRTRDHFR